MLEIYSRVHSTSKKLDKTWIYRESWKFGAYPNSTPVLWSHTNNNQLREQVKFMRYPGWDASGGTMDRGALTFFGEKKRDQRFFGRKNGGINIFRKKNRGRGLLLKRKRGASSFFHRKTYILIFLKYHLRVRKLLF